MAFDKNGNLWYADLDNGMEVELTKASHYSVVGNTRSDCVAGTGCMLSQIVIDSAGNHWVTDASCTGNLYENGQVKLSAGDALEGVAISTLNPSHQAHVYVAVTNFCGNYPFGFIGDTTDLYILPYPYSSGSLDAPGLTTLLYFSDWGNDKVWLTVDYA